MRHNPERPTVAERVRVVFNRFRDLLNRRELESELEEELRFHHEMLERDLRGDGVDDNEARYAARRRFGNVTSIREESRTMWSFRIIESVSKDVRFAFRSFSRARAFTSVVLITLALGIGATTAVYSVVDGILLRPLPYPTPERLVAPWPSHFVSAAELQYMQTNAKSYAGGVAAFSPGWGVVLTQPAVATQIAGARTSANFFRVLGVPPHIGRTFNDAESATGASPVAILSWPIWLSRFGADSTIIGKPIILDGRSTEVVGVMPRGFSILQSNAELWMPMSIDPSSPFYKGANAFLVGRLAPGVGIEAARSEIRTMAPRMRDEFSFDENYGTDIDVVSLQERIVGDVRTMLLVLLGAVAFLVLIAGANVANLLLARAGARRQEFALRTALGASRTRVIRQLAVESLMLAVAGGVLGVGVGALGVIGLEQLLPADLPRVDSIRIDLRVLGVVSAITVTVGLVFGLWPALIASRESPQQDLHGGRSMGSVIGRSTRRALVIAEVALALVLVVGASLMTETMRQLSNVDPGFRSHNVLTFTVQASGESIRSGAERVQYFDRLFEVIEQTPGVEQVGSIQHLPLSGSSWQSDTEIDGRPLAPAATPFRPGFRIVGGNYFHTLNIPVLEGRAFDHNDDQNRPRVVAVNAAFARAQFPGESAIGKRIRPNRFDWLTIVGVVGDVRHGSLTENANPEFYVPLSQSPQAQAQIVVRTTIAPLSLAREVHDRVAALNSAVPISNLRTLDRHLSASVNESRVVMILMMAFAFVGLALGVVGIYGVVAYTVAMRTREIGVRIALGASRRSVAVLLLREGVIHSVVGIVIGTGAALLLSRGVQSLLFGVSATSAPTYATVSAILLVAALTASWLPARRASKADPMAALRAE